MISIYRVFQNILQSRSLFTDKLILWKPFLCIGGVVNFLGVPAGISRSAYCKFAATGLRLPPRL